MNDPNEISSKGIPNMPAGLSIEQLANISKISGTMSGVSSEVDKANKGVEDFTKKFGVLISEIDKISDKFLKALEGVSKKVDEDGKKFKFTVKGISKEVSGISKEFTKFGRDAVEHMGIAGHAVSKFFEILKAAPLIGKFAGILSAFTMIALGHKLFEEEEKARALRVGLTFAQYTGQLETVKNTSVGLLKELHNNFGMSWDAAEKFLSSLGTLGRIELGKTGERFTNLALEVKKLSVATGLSTDVIVGDISKLYRATGMFGTETDKVTQSLKDMYTWATASGLRIDEYSKMTMKAVDQMRLLGVEHRALKGMSELFGGIRGAFGEFRERVGMGGITEMFAKVTDVVGRVMSETPLFMRAMGLKKPGEIAGAWEEVQRGKVSPVEIFQRWIEKMIMPIRTEKGREEALGIQFGGTPPAFALGKEMMKKYEDLIELTKRIKDGDESARKDYIAAQKELEAHMKDAKKLAMESLPPLQRIEIVLDEFMRKGLGELTKVITGMLGMILNALSSIAIGIGVVSGIIYKEDYAVAWKAMKASTDKMMEGIEGSKLALKTMSKNLAEKGLDIGDFDILNELNLKYLEKIRLVEPLVEPTTPAERRRMKANKQESGNDFGTGFEAGIAAGNKNAWEAGKWLWKKLGDVAAPPAGAEEIPAGRLSGNMSMGGVGMTEPVIVPRGKVRVDKTSTFGALEFKITLTAADIFKVTSGGI